MNKNYYGLNIKKIEKKHKAKYIGDFCVKTVNGWSDIPRSIFFCKNPNRNLGHSNYFGYHTDRKKNLYISNGESAFSEPIIGLKKENGDILISGFRHDYVENEDYMIDGGRDYVRMTLNKGELVYLLCYDNKLKEVNIKTIQKKLNLAEKEYE